MSVFDFVDYKAVVREKIHENSNVTGYKGDLASAAGCQRAYLSQVMHGHVHLTPDHAAGLASFWSLPALERDYFLELVNLARAATPTLRGLINNKLAELKKAHTSVTGRIKKPKIESIQLQSHYYSSWHFSAIHILVTISKFRTVKTIAERLNLDSESVRSALMTLEQLGLLKRQKEQWVPVSFDLHLPRHSPLTSINHMNWRLQAVQDSQKDHDGSVHFTGVFSMNEKDFNEIKQKILHLISETRETALKSPEEEVVAFTCDFFKV